MVTTLKKNHHYNILYTQRIEGIVIDVLLLCCNALYENRLGRRVVYTCVARGQSAGRSCNMRTLIAAIKIWSPRAVHHCSCVVSSPAMASILLHRTHSPAMTVFRRGNCEGIYIYTHIHVQYDVIRTVSRLIVVTYLHRILYSGANYGCISLVARGEGEQLMTSTRPFLRYLYEVYIGYTLYAYYMCATISFGRIRNTVVTVHRYQ